MKRAIILSLVLFVLLLGVTAAFSAGSSASAEHAHHECIGEVCSVCACLFFSERFAESVLLPLVLFLAWLPIGSGLRASLPCGAAPVLSRTPVTNKVKLSN